MKNLKLIPFSIFLLNLILGFSGIINSTPFIAEKPVGYDTLTFIHASDPHVCNLTGYHPLFVEKRQHFGNNREPLLQFFNTVPATHKADFIAITGDNIDYFESETAKGGMLDTQIEQYTGLIDLCNIPVYLTLGNHDLASYYVDSESTYTSNQFNAEKARATWIRNTPCFKNGTYYSRLFKIGTTSFRLIFLDNGYSATREVSDKLLPFIIDQSQLLWLDAELKASDSDIELIFMHIPVTYGQSADSKIITESFASYSTKTAGQFNLLTVLEKNSSSRIIFAGHKHINNINNYTFTNGNMLTQVLTAGFGYDPNAWRMIKLTDKNIIIYLPGSSKSEYVITLNK